MSYPTCRRARPAGSAELPYTRSPSLTRRLSHTPACETSAASHRGRGVACTSDSAATEQQEERQASGTLQLVDVPLEEHRLGISTARLGWCAAVRTAHPCRRLLVRPAMRLLRPSQPNTAGSTAYTSDGSPSTFRSRGAPSTGGGISFLKGSAEVSAFSRTHSRPSSCTHMVFPSPDPALI
jgi:hypothetical protein